VTAVQRRLETAATAKGIVLLVPTGLDASPPLDADPVMVERLLGNVIQNGIEHSPPGGVVRLDVKLVGAWAEVQVTDTGPGIAADQIGLVFERFFRGDRGTQPAKGGMGLGLAIAKRIVELHGGEIRARSPPGGGATFRFTLPLVSSVSESISFPAESPMNTTRREHDRGIA
jgi:signal transduction histidine kinase